MIRFAPKPIRLAVTAFFILGSLTQAALENYGAIGNRKARMRSRVSRQ